MKLKSASLDTTQIDYVNNLVIGLEQPIWNEVFVDHTVKKVSC